MTYLLLWINAKCNSSYKAYLNLGLYCIDDGPCLPLGHGRYLEIKLRRDRAIKYIMAADKLHLDDHNVMNTACWYYTKRMKYDKALEYASRAYELLPSHLYYGWQKCKLLYLLKRQGEALAIANTLLDNAEGFVFRSAVAIFVATLTLQLDEAALDHVLTLLNRYVIINLCTDDGITLCKKSENTAYGVLHTQLIPIYFRLKAYKELLFCYEQALAGACADISGYEMATRAAMALGCPPPAGPDDGSGHEEVHNMTDMQLFRYSIEQYTTDYAWDEYCGFVV